MAAIEFKIVVSNPDLDTALELAERLRSSVVNDQELLSAGTGSKVSVSQVMRLFS
jgi:hypothetical protein